MRTVSPPPRTEVLEDPLNPPPPMETPFIMKPLLKGLMKTGGGCRGIMMTGAPVAGGLMITMLLGRW